MGRQTKQDLPNVLEAEQALLGAIMVNAASMSAIPANLTDQHFEEPLHGAIFREMKRMKAAGKKITTVAVKMAVTDAPEKIGELTFSQYLAALCTEAVSIINVPDFAAAILDAAQRRELVGLAQKLHRIAYQHELEIPDDIRAIETRLAQVRVERVGRGGEEESFSEAVDATLDSTDDAYHGRYPSGLDCGIPELHSLTGLWQPGQLIILGGDVKQGKSAAAWQTFFNIAEKHAVAGNSGEMPRSQIIMREKARRTGISAKRQKLGRVSEIEMQELVRAGAEMKRFKHTDIDCQRRTLEQIDARIERLVGEYGIQAYYIDHLLKLLWTGKMEDADDFKKANRATSTLKDIAMKHKIPIIALTHLNKTDSSFQTFGRQSYEARLRSAQRRRPTYKQLLGNIDKDADHAVIVFNARPVVAGMKPEEGTSDYDLWETVMDEVNGKAEFILTLSREEDFPRWKQVEWHGETTSYGPPFKQAFNERERLI